MRNKKAEFIIGFLSFAFLSALLSCATDNAPLQIENSLPQNEIEYYNDSFDKMREDLWDRAGYLYRKEQVQNFKQAEMRFDNSKLIIQTKTGSFSKGGLGSKYALRGDFDIQLDCQIDFIKGVSDMDMDQLFSFAVLDKSLKAGKMNVATIGLSMKGGSDRRNLFSSCVINGKRKKGDAHKIENFNGSFRFLRTGKTIRTFYKKAGAVGWNQMNTFHVTENDMIIGFQLRNFFGKRTIIQANNSVTAELYNFKINATQEIIEDEI